jgi:ABC-type multidrug transport system ATPase subunit
MTLQHGGFDSGVPGQPVPGQLTPDDLTPDQIKADRAALRRIWGRPSKREPDNAAPDQTAPEQTGPEQTGPEQTGPDNAAREQAAPDCEVPDQAVPDQAVPGQAVPGQAVPEREATDWAVWDRAALSRAALDLTELDSTESDSTGSDLTASDLAGPGQVSGRHSPGLEPGWPAVSDDLALASRGLTKRYGRQLAVDGIDLAVPVGSVYGFLGPNGSGKTTTIRLLLGLIQPTDGVFEVLGLPMPQGQQEALPMVGSLVEGPAFYPHLSGRANLARFDAADRTTSRVGSQERVERALDRVGLLAAADKRYKAYSLGMKQRLGIATSLLRPRRVVILDEPTNGLDPQGTREVRALIRQIAADGATVFVSSHLLAEVEQVCTHVGVMRAGRLVYQGPLAQLRGEARLLVRTPKPDLAAKVLAELGLAGVAQSGLDVTAELGTMLPEVICERLVLAGVPVAGLETPRRSLEDEFVELTGEGFDVG